MTTSLETQLVTAMLGRSRPSVLMTDGYKFSMAQAGFPLRPETFYLSFRRPGWYYIPFDFAEVVRNLCPLAASPEDSAYLKDFGYALTGAMEVALRATPRIWSAPKGSWVREREPILSVTAPSFLASWLEPLLVWLHYPIQIATALLEGECSELFCRSEAEANIIRLVEKSLNRTDSVTVAVRNASSRITVKNNAERLVRSVGGEAERVFEVGMRSANCLAWHKEALAEVAACGIRSTSSVFLAKELGLTPVGTTGHEHQQRWGRDIDGYRAIRDMRAAPPSYLFDTYDAMEVGIPDAIAVMREEPARDASVRFDSGDLEAQLGAFVAAGVTPTFVFMDSMKPERVSELERVATLLNVAPAKRLYGVGGYLVGAALLNALSRDRVAAVYKLSSSGSRPAMKFSVPGKTSIPGRPIVFRRISGSGPVGLIGQEGEVAPNGYERLRASDRPRSSAEAVALSSQTARFVRELQRFHFRGAGSRNSGALQSVSGNSGDV